mmetsp:Transcript_46275/g.51745  ORF Transcript_46275/g.51745 Transcript_46275/m.51745 type:complete len:82 (-) Transcript_46275:333-578(-)
MEWNGMEEEEEQIKEMIHSMRILVVYYLKSHSTPSQSQQKRRDDGRGEELGMVYHASVIGNTTQQQLTRATFLISSRGQER